MDLKNTFQDLKDKIAKSNKNAAKNRNYYPIQEQATLKEIWEYVPCECPSNCTCKKYQCSNHWKLKASLSFKEILPAFLRMFVDISLHDRIIGWIQGTRDCPSKIPPRASGLVFVLETLQKNWDNLYSDMLNHNKTLLCNDWCNASLQKQWDFPVRRPSVYRAKQFCVLFPDIGIPYDTNSRRKIINFLNFKGRSYFELLNELRKWILAILKSENQPLSNFRRLDSPADHLPFDRNFIIFRKENLNYGTTYSPVERPLSRIIDKYFYRPSG